jgi:hypothetical protein
VRRELLRRAGRLLLLDRGRVTAPQAQRLLQSWKWVHVPFTVLLVVLSAVHVVDALPRAW